MTIKKKKLTSTYINGRCKFHGSLSTGPKTTKNKKQLASNEFKSEILLTLKQGKAGRKDMPPNLYANVKGAATYYRYRDPRTGKFHGLGTDKAQAVSDANALNSTLYGLIQNERINRISTRQGMPFDAWLVKYMAICKTRNLADNTMRSKKSMIKKWAKALADRAINEITVLDIASVLSGLRDEGKERMAQSMRSAAIDIFKDAIAEGVTDDNPAAKTRNPTVKVKRARLSLDEFNVIYETAGQLDAWVQNAMMLALLTGQRRDDVCNMQFSDVKNGMLHIIQRKTGTKVRIDTRLQLVSVSRTIASVIKQCRDNVISRYMVHHCVPHGNCIIGDIVWRDTATRSFARARDLSGLEWKGVPPTFHEIRSLSERLYRDQGVDTQTLLGHKDQRTTDGYHDSRGHDWSEIRV